MNRGNVSWAQFWRASSSLRVYGGNRTTRRLAARKDWPSYKKARQNGALVDTKLSWISSNKRKLHISQPFRVL
jgi:hypothetical protein